MKLALVFLLVACQRDRSISPDLATYLADVTALDDEHRAAEIESWKMDRDTWRRVVVRGPFSELYDDYARNFRSPSWSGAIATRMHYADDPELTLDQARTRWVLPTLFPSEVATAGGRPIDAVFVLHEGRWYALVGIGKAITERVRRKAPECAVTIDAPAASKSCRDVAYLVADATLRDQDARFQRACALAKTACAKSSP